MTTQAFIARNGLIVNTNILVVNVATGRIGVNTASPNVSFQVVANDAIAIPTGNTAQRPTGAAGYIRYNSDTSSFEGFTTAWGGIGGGANAVGATGLIQYSNGSGGLAASANLSFDGTQVLFVPYVIGASNGNLNLLANTTSGGGVVVIPSGTGAQVSQLGNSSVFITDVTVNGFSVRKQKLQALGALSSITPDCSNGNIFEFTLSANATVNAPTNLQPGFYTFIVHNSTFAITTWNAVFKWPGGTAPQSTIGGTDIISFVANATNMFGSLVPGLA